MTPRAFAWPALALYMWAAASAAHAVLPLCVTARSSVLEICRAAERDQQSLKTTRDALREALGRDPEAAQPATIDAIVAFKLAKTQAIKSYGAYVEATPFLDDTDAGEVRRNNAPWVGADQVQMDRSVRELPAPIQNAVNQRLRGGASPQPAGSRTVVDSKGSVLPSDLPNKDKQAANSPKAVSSDVGPSATDEQQHGIAQMGSSLMGISAAAGGMTTNVDAVARAADSGGGAAKPSAPSPQTQAAAKTLAAGQPAAAQKALDAVIKANPNDSQALSLRAQARAAQGDREGALKDAQQALALNPQDTAARARVAEYEGLAQAAKKTGSFKADFGAALSADQGAGGGSREGARPRAGAAADGPGLSGGGGGWSGGGDWGGSGQEESFSAAQRPLVAHARQQAAIGDNDHALLLLQQARDLDPTRPAIFDLIAEVSNSEKNYAGAIAAAEQALKLNPADARALRAKSSGEFESGDYAAAFADADRAVKLDPQNGLGFLYRAMAAEKLGRTAQALQDYETSQGLDPTLVPLAAKGLARLRGAPALPVPAPGRLAFRVGAIAASTLLIILGLMGTATGRGLITRPRDPATTARSEDDADAAAPTAVGAAVASTVAVGSFIGGHYRITRELGRGGMGVVFQAFDETLRRPVAVKQMQRAGRERPEELQRFLREARLVAQLKHPHIAEIYSVVDNGDLLLVFEYVDGQTLDRFISGAKPSPAETRRVIAEVAAALDYAHGQKIVHRDLKPQNVMVAKNGAVKVMDFGIAHQSSSGADLTQTTRASGTPPYMAPEQGMGSVSKAADLYALAVMTYEMLTGRRPFSGPGYLEQKLRREYPLVTTLAPALPKGLDALLSRALDPDPTKRPASCGAFADELARALGATPSRV